MKTIQPFTKDNYPKGYSRQDCLEQIRVTESRLTDTKRSIASITAELKELRKELKQGGREN
jgi:hypothetical protein